MRDAPISTLKSHRSAGAVPRRDAPPERATRTPGAPSGRGPNPFALPPMAHMAMGAAAATIEAIVRVRRGDVVDPSALAAALGADVEASLGAARDAATALAAFCDVEHLVGRTIPGDASRTGRESAATVTLALNPAFVDLVDRPPVPDAAAGDAPEVGVDVAAWIAALAAPRGREPVLHLGLRRRGEGGRDVADLALLLSRAGAATVTVEAALSRGAAAALLRAEIHAGGRPPVVIVASDHLVDRPRTDDDPWNAPRPREDGATAFARGATPWLGAMRCRCVWAVPEDAVPPPGLDGLIAGCVGPIRPGAAWSMERVAEAIGAGVGHAGVASIAATLDDPRDAGARATAARAIASTGMAIDDACALVARSLVPSATIGPNEAATDDFDIALVAQDEEVALLYARAREVAMAGGRILFSGPPGGGKSTLARTIAARMRESGAAGPAVAVSGSEILMRPYGGTERALERLWRRVEIARAPLVIGEIDAMCGVRDPSGSSSGNSYLVRALTDEFLRRFDAHPGVPVLATCNDPAAVDPAIRRRFAVHHVIGDELPPHLERRAWSKLLGMDPPASWVPAGAAPSDFAAARVRCRMLGTFDAASLALAVAREREARNGRRPATVKTTGAVH